MATSALFSLLKAFVAGPEWTLPLSSTDDYFTVAGSFGSPRQDVECLIDTGSANLAVAGCAPTCAPAAASRTPLPASAHAPNRAARTSKAQLLRSTLRGSPQMGLIRFNTYGSAAAKARAVGSGVGLYRRRRSHRSVGIWEDSLYGVRRTILRYVAYRSLPKRIIVVRVLEPGPVWGNDLGHKISGRVHPWSGVPGAFGPPAGR